ncbi:MAG: hypothetical protein KDD99_17840, partial [Bacteroidetes bacterium]|nr:hypothetical protein [Bacteroidota bacterium]
MRTSSLTIFGALLFFHIFLSAQTNPAAIDSSSDSTLSFAPGIKLDLNVYPSTESSGTNISTKTLQPLYLIDGKPVIKKGQIPSDNYPQNTSILQVSPSEIISIKYIQPEIARTRFGPRADQGAIMIKTRMGTRRFQPVFSFSSYSGVQWVSRRPQMLGAQDYIMLANEAYQNSGQQSPYTYSALTPDTDWQKEIFRPGYIQNYHLSLNGRKKRSSYLLSANYLHNQNPFIHASQEQISAKFSGKWALSDNLTAGGQGSLSLGKLKGLFFPLDSGVNESLISQALFYPPNISATSNDLSSSELNGLRNGITNPLVIDDHRKETFQRRLSMAQAWLNGHFGDFSFEGKWAVDNTFDQKNQFVSAALLQGPNLKNLFSSNLWSLSHHYQFNYQFDHFFHYQSELNLITKLEHQYQNWGFERLKGNGVNGPEADISTANILSSYEASNQWHQYAGIVRAEYNFRRQYIASANLRLQHSPQFATQKRSILLPSFSLVWNIDDEDFFRRHIGYFFDMVQLGTSFGMSGNEQARIFPQLSNILWNHPGSFQNDLLSHAWLANRSESLGWEKTQEWDLNMRVRFWQSRIEFSAVRYIKSTRDILTLTSHPDQGYQWQNLGMVTNKGWELETRIRGINLNRVGIYGGANITFNNNRLDDLGNLDQKTTPGFLGSGPLSEPIMILEPGKPIGNFYGYQTDGLYQTGDNFDKKKKKSPG